MLYNNTMFNSEIRNFRCSIWPCILDTSAWTASFKASMFDDLCHTPLMSNLMRFKWRHSRWVEWGCFAIAQKNCVMNRLKWLNKGCDQPKTSHTDACGAKSLTSLDRSETLRPQNPGVCQRMCARISADPCVTQGESAREVPSGNWISLLCIGHSCLDAYRVTRDLFSMMSFMPFQFRNSWCVSLRCLRLWLWCGRTLPRNGVNIGPGMLLSL